MGSRRVTLSTVALSVIVAGAGLAPAAIASPPPRSAATSSEATTSGIRLADITAADGVVLKANVIEPSTAGRHPAIVFVNSWSLNDAEYLVQAHILAGKGYVVLSYTTRGFWGSGGTIDTAGPLDTADVSTVVDWLLAHTSADPAKIGFAGVSYGSGISLIGAAHDQRIRAVVAMSTWADLGASLYANDTRSGQAAALLKLAAQLTGRPGPDLNEALDRFFGNRDVDAVHAWAKVRSAATYVDALNQNGPAVLLANAYGDSLFGPNPLIDFYGKLTVPKRLEFSPGDHAVAEGLGLAGLPNHVWTSLYRWFDHYLVGDDTGITTEPPVVLYPRSGGAPESYSNWSDVAGSTARYPLGAARWYDGTGALAPGAAPGWHRQIWSGIDTVANSGLALLTNGWEAITGIPPTAWLPAVNRLHAGVWVSDALDENSQLRGIARMHLTATPTQSDGMLVAYLYDLDSLGTGKLITHVPYTGGTAGAPVTLDLAFPATSWDVPAGHRLALVVDTEDPLYLDTNRIGNTVTFDSPAEDPSWLEVPLR